MGETERERISEKKYNNFLATLSFMYFTIFRQMKIVRCMKLKVAKKLTIFWTYSVLLLCILIYLSSTLFTIQYKRNIYIYIYIYIYVNIYIYIYISAVELLCRYRYILIDISFFFYSYYCYQYAIIINIIGLYNKV